MLYYITLAVDIRSWAERWIKSRDRDNRTAAASRAGSRLARSQSVRRRPVWTSYRPRLHHAPISTQHSQLHIIAIRYRSWSRPRV